MACLAACNSAFSLAIISRIRFSLLLDEDRPVDSLGFSSLMEAFFVVLVVAAPAVLELAFSFGVAFLIGAAGGFVAMVVLTPWRLMAGLLNGSAAHLSVE